MSLLRADARQIPLVDGCVQCCVTSPPYFGLRDYGHAGQIGLESSPDAYVAELVAVFREVRRVLRDDGPVWLNLGDSHAGYWGDKTAKKEGRRSSADTNGWTNDFNMNAKPDFHTVFDASGIKPKDLVGIPWRVAFALQADGWWLRSDVIWSKPNPMPESVTDRCTKSHEYIFMLTKSAKYYYDADAIKEPISASFANDPRHKTGGNTNNDKAGYAAAGAQNPKGPHRLFGKGNAKTFRGGGAYTKGQSFDNTALVERESHGNVPNETGLRNKRSVWTVATKPFKGAHFATFPPDLIKPCILAGSKPGDTVLDPFGGAGTTGVVAQKHGRNAILIELNPAYNVMAERRIGGFQALL